MAIFSKKSRNKHKNANTVKGNSAIMTSGDNKGNPGMKAPEGKKGKPAKKNNGIFKGIISGTLITERLILKDIRYAALVAGLAIVFIANRFNAEHVERQIIVLEQEVRDLRAESLSVSAALGSVSRQSEISDMVKERGLGLEELREPPYRIVVHE